MKEKYCIFYENPAADGSLAEYSTEKGEKGRKRGRKKKEGRGKGCWSGATRRRKISSPCSTRIKVKRIRPEEHKGFPWHFITPEPTVASVARDQPSFSLSFEFCPLPPVPRFAWPRGNLNGNVNSRGEHVRRGLWSIRFVRFLLFSFHPFLSLSLSFFLSFLPFSPFVRANDPDWNFSTRNSVASGYFVFDRIFFLFFLFFCFPRNSIFQLSPENSSILRSILIYLLQFSIKRYPRERIEIPGWILSFRSYIFGISINIIETEWCLSRFRKKKNKERKIIYRGEKNKDAKVVLTVLQPDRNSQSKRESRR